MISVALLVVLFSVQRYATSKVGFAIGPSLLLWFCCLGGIGIYNLSLYGPTAFKAFNPLYIIYYFGRNPFQAWLSLGGCLLCATGNHHSLLIYNQLNVQHFFPFGCRLIHFVGYLYYQAFINEIRFSSVIA
jgi:K+ transporter